MRRSRSCLSRVDYSRLRELKYGVYGLLIASILAVQALGSRRPRLAARDRHSRSSRSRPPSSARSCSSSRSSAFIVDRVAAAARPRHDRADACSLALIPAALVMLQPDLGSGLVYIVIGLAVLFVAGTPLAPLRRAVRARRGGDRARPRGRAGGRRDRPARLPEGAPDGVPATRRRTPPTRATSRTSRASPSAPVRRPAAATDATQTKLNFLPEHHTDFIFAVVGERWGFVGAALVLSLYALLIWRGLRILTISKNLFGAHHRRRHRRDAAVPGLRQRRHERGDHADHRDPAAAHELRRILGPDHFPGRRPAAVDLRAGRARLHRSRAASWLSKENVQP